MAATPIRKYRLTSLDEPTDRMLARLMESVSATARKRAEAAHRAYFAGIGTLVREVRTLWKAKDVSRSE